MPAYYTNSPRETEPKSPYKSGVNLLRPSTPSRTTNILPKSIIKVFGSESHSRNDNIFACDAPDVSKLVQFSDRRPDICGGFCDIYRGVHKKKGAVALKIPRLRYSEANVKRRLLREIETWYNLHHENIMPLLGVVQRKDDIYMVSEWAENGTLLSYVRAHPGVNKVHLLKGAASGIAYLHERDIIHGDIKAVNILINQHNVPQLIDFGLSKTRSMMTSSEVAGAGSIPWSAPELFEGKSKTQYSDVYAFAMTMSETLSGFPPFSALGSAPAIIKAVITGHRPPIKPATSEDGFSYEAVWELAQEGWSVSPHDRPTMKNAFTRLQDVAWQISVVQNPIVVQPFEVPIGESYLTSEKAMQNIFQDQPPIDSTSYISMPSPKTEDSTPPIFRAGYYRALYSFKAMNAGELSFNTGQLVKCYRRERDGWVVALDVDGKPSSHALVPEAYLKYVGNMRSLNVLGDMPLVRADSPIIPPTPLADSASYPSAYQASQDAGDSDPALPPAKNDVSPAQDGQLNDNSFSRPERDVQSRRQTSYKSLWSTIFEGPSSTSLMQIVGSYSSDSDFGTSSMEHPKVSTSCNKPSKRRSTSVQHRKSKRKSTGRSSSAPAELKRLADPIDQPVDIPSAPVSGEADSIDEANDQPMPFGYSTLWSNLLRPSRGILLSS